MLRNANRQETFRVVFDAVHIHVEGMVYVRLNSDTVDDKTRLSRTIGSMNEDIAATRQKGSELKDFRSFFPPSLLELNIEFGINLCFK